MPLQNELPDNIKQEIVQGLEESVRRNLSDAVLLSGGLDTSILTCLAVKWSKPYAVTVAFKGAPAPDLEFAGMIAKKFELEHDYHIFDEDELEEALIPTIKVLKTYDPMEIRNSAAAFIGLRQVRNKGCKSAMTGDGGDELFAGYSFFFGLEKEALDQALQNMWRQMNFSSIPLAEHLSMEAKLPILDPVFKEFAMQLDSSYKVREEQGKAWGKWCLRKAFSDMLPPEILWRVKAPLEVGSGTTTLPQFFANKISDTDFKAKQSRIWQQDEVVIRDKEHLHYYEIYRENIGVPGSKTAGGRKCPECNSALPEKTNFCRVCGAYPV